MDLIISKSKDTNLWSNSNPVGSQALRIIKLVKEVGKYLYDLQHLHFRNLGSSNDVDYSMKKRQAVKFGADIGQRNISDMPFFELIELKFKNLSK